MQNRILIYTFINLDNPPENRQIHNLAGLLTIGSSKYSPSHVIKHSGIRALSPFTVAGAVTDFTVFPIKTIVTKFQY